jgi:hypothetical protein
LNDRSGVSLSTRLLTLARILSAIAGFIAAAVLFVGALGVAIGTVKS